MPSYAELAVEVVAEVQLSLPVDTFLIARARGLAFDPTSDPGSELNGKTIRYDGTAPIEQQQWLVGECVADDVLRERGLERNRDAKRAIVAAWIRRL